MSKTFKSAITGHPRRLHLEENEHGVNIHASDPEWRDGYGITIATSDAPALALAILEAAYGSDQPAPDRIGEAWAALYAHIIEEDRATAEAEAQAKLEAEALGLFNTLQVEIHGILGPNWVNVTEFPNIETKRKWLAVARRARELNKEEK